MRKESLQLLSIYTDTHKTAACLLERNYDGSQISLLDGWESSRSDRDVLKMVKRLGTDARHILCNQDSTQDGNPHSALAELLKNVGYRTAKAVSRINAIVGEAAKDVLEEKGKLHTEDFPFNALITEELSTNREAFAPITMATLQAFVNYFMLEYDPSQPLQNMPDLEVASEAYLLGDFLEIPGYPKTRKQPEKTEPQKSAEQIALEKEQAERNHYQNLIRPMTGYGGLFIL